MSNSKYTNLKYNKLEMYKYCDNALKEIYEEYRATLISFANIIL